MANWKSHFGPTLQRATLGSLATTAPEEFANQAQSA